MVHRFKDLQVLAGLCNVACYTTTAYFEMSIVCRWLRGKAFNVEEVKGMLTRYFEEVRSIRMSLHHLHAVHACLDRGQDCLALMQAMARVCRGSQAVQTPTFIIQWDNECGQIVSQLISSQPVLVMLIPACSS